MFKNTSLRSFLDSASEEPYIIGVSYFLKWDVKILFRCALLLPLRLSKRGKYSDWEFQSLFISTFSFFLFHPSVYEKWLVYSKWYWRVGDDLEIRSLCCSCRRPDCGLQDPHQGFHNCLELKHWRSSALLWSLQAPTHIWHIHITHRERHANKNKMNP